MDQHTPPHEQHRRDEEESASATQPPASPGAAEPAAPRGRLRRLVRTVTGTLPKPQPRLRFDVPPMTPEDQLVVIEAKENDESILQRPLWAGFMATVGVGIALGVFFIVTSTQELLIWILAALFIALGLDPIVRWFERRGKPRALGVAVAVLALLAIFGGFIGTLIPTIVDQTSQLVRNIPGWVEDFIHSPLFQDLDSQFQVRDRVQEEVNKFFANPEAVTQVFGGLFGFGTAIFQSGFSALIIFVLTLYFLSSLPTMKSWLYRLGPASNRARVRALSDQITSSVGNYVMGQAFVALINAIVAFTAMSIAGVPYSVLLSFVVLLLAFIPLVGALTAGVFVTVIALTAGWQTALIFAAIYFVYLQVEAYFVSPRIMQRAVAVPGSVAVIAVIAGGSLLGVLGALMAIPMAAGVMILLKEVWLPRQDAR
ncbi:AI-2E family transporter [Micrococcoides hystricis]|uniref:AI-2E family transporter n=1 Tax=Micrococcoides hystricis TaxID=1572761 RepID=A0ABV6PBV3_9MICC